jgi:hypothetical protein
MLGCVSSLASIFKPLRQQSRILVSHDKRTMPRALASFVASGASSPAVLLVIPQSASIREVVEALILIPKSPSDR